MRERWEQNLRAHASVLLFAVVVLLLGACQTILPQSGELPREDRLRERLQEFHHALGNNDIEKWYAMTSPVIRQKMTLDEFKKDLRWKEDRSKSKIEGELLRNCSCVQMQLLRCVLVVGISVDLPGQPPLKERPLETWEFGDGEWYWGYMGPDLRGRCPGEK